MRQAILLVLVLAGIILLIFTGCSSDKKSSPCLTCPGPNPAIEVARQFLADNQDQWPLRDGLDEWRLADVDHGAGGTTYLRFLQYYRGQRVLDGYASIRVRDDLPTVEGRVYFIEGVSTGITINVSAADAFRIATKHLNWDGEISYTWSSGEPIIIKHDGKFHLCWQVTLQPDSYFGYWIYHISTAGGDVVNFYFNDYIDLPSLD